MISLISSLEIIKVVNPDIFLWIAASVADAAAFIHNCIKNTIINKYLIV